MAWLRQDAIFSVLLLLASFVTWESPATAEEIQPGVRLSYICVHPERCDPKTDVPIIMLHGLTDIKETYDGIYQDVSSLTQRTVCVYDARNHGGSSWNETFSVDVLAEDLRNFMNLMKIEKAVIVGHSMGGRTAMKFALSNPSKVEGIFVEDMGLQSIPEASVQAINFRIRFLISSLDVIPDDAGETTAKKAVLDHLKKISKQPLPQHFVNYLPLSFRDGAWQWKTNFAAISKVLENPVAFFPKLREGTYEGKALFIYGTNSMYKVGEQKDDIKKLFPNAEFVGVEGAGHYIHFRYTENLNDFMHPEYAKELFKFLK